MSLFACVCALPALIHGFGVERLLQPGSMGLGSEEILESEVHQSQVGRRNPLGDETQQIWLALAWISAHGPWPLRQHFAAKEGEWMQISPFRITGSKEATHILNFCSCPTPMTGPFKHLSAVLSEINVWAKCSNFWVVTSRSPESYLMNIGLCNFKTLIIGGYKLLRKRDSSSLNYAV